MHRYFILLISILFAGAMTAQDLRHYEYLQESSIGGKVRRLGGEEQKKRLGGEEQKGSIGGEEFSSRKERDTLNHSSIRDLYFFTQMPATPYKPSGKKWTNRLYDKVFHENLILIKRPGFLITADPVFDCELGRDIYRPANTWVNTRGMQWYGKIDLKTEDRKLKTVSPTFEFYANYLESQGKYPTYIDSLAWKSKGLPGQGFFYRENEVWEPSYATGWVRYTPNKYFTFEAGQGKNFFGNGYRSMLLSDQAPNAPYFRIDTKLWRIHYTNLWAEFQDNAYRDGPLGSYQKKYGAFHYLSYSITNRLEVSFFDAVIWQGRDSLHQRGFELTYLNPVIFLRPTEWTVGSPDNALVGMNLDYRFFDNTFLYGQLLIDDIAISHIKLQDGIFANKIAGQIGAKTYFRIRDTKHGTRDTEPQERRNTKHGTRDTEPREMHSSGSRVTSFETPKVIPSAIFLQTEFNFARPYTYSHWSRKVNYGHMSQTLAHPLGANFFEWVNFARLNLNRFTLEARYSLAKFGADYDSLNYGQDIFKNYETMVSRYGNFIGQGLSTTLTYKSLTASYLFNPSSLFNIFATITDRHQITEAGDKHSLWFTFGIRNSLRNLYYDY
jgi:hypothetical protein